jgi:hypothetical protein
MIIIARSIVSLAILLLAAHIALMNWGCVVVSMRNKRRGIDKYHSTVPLISFVLAVVAAIIFPRHDKAVWMSWVPVLDIAHLNLVLSLLFLPVWLIRELVSKGKQSLR